MEVDCYGNYSVSRENSQKLKKGGNMCCRVKDGCIMCMLFSYEIDVSIRVNISDKELIGRCADAQ